MAKKKDRYTKLKMKFNNCKTGDLSIVLLVAALSIFGTIMVFSASYYMALSTEGSAYAYLKKHLFWLALGAIAMFITSNIDYHLYFKMYRMVYIFGIGMLVAVLVPGIGSGTAGATRWIIIGGISIMPGEFAKACIIVYIAGFLGRYPAAINKVGGVFWIAGLTGVYAALILMQPNMSTAFTIIFICAGMLLMAGARGIHLAILSIMGVAGGTVLVMSSAYRRARYLSFIKPFEHAMDEGFQVVQSLMALGTGGFKGLGLGNSIQKNLYISQSHNDFILAIIGEELGFIGVIGLMSLYILLIWRGYKAAMNASDRYGMMLAVGITTMIGVQAAINIAVVTSSMPPTGVVLPFVSYGGNALLIMLALSGILVNVSKNSDSCVANPLGAAPEYGVSFKDEGSSSGTGRHRRRKQR